MSRLKWDQLPLVSQSSDSFGLFAKFALRFSGFMLLSYNKP